MTFRGFEIQVALPIVAIVSIMLVIFCSLFDILDWSLPAIFGIAVIVIFIATKKGKRIWQISGVPNIAGCFAIMASECVALFILLPDDRTEPTAEQLAANLWFHGLKYLLILFVMVAGFAAIGWQMWRASRMLSAAEGERIGGIVAGFATILAWGIMLLVASLWLSQGGPLIRAINQAIQ